MKLLPLVLLLACATVPRGSAYCTSSDPARLTIDPPRDQPMPSCDDAQAVLAYARKLLADSGIGWTPARSGRFEARDCWCNDIQPATMCRQACGEALLHQWETDHCGASLVHEDLHLYEQGALGLEPLAEVEDPHLNWIPKGYYGLSNLFAWSNAQRLAAVVTPTKWQASCAIYFGQGGPHAIPPAMEAALRAHGWSQMFDAWRATPWGKVTP